MSRKLSRNPTSLENIMSHSIRWPHDPWPQKVWAETIVSNLQETDESIAFFSGLAPRFWTDIEISEKIRKILNHLYDEKIYFRECLK